jgi:DNA-binding transcriptional MerR regulator
MTTTGEGRRIGELAAASGLTVRTLHYYEEIGLLSASARTGAGHRLYSDADVERLYRICLLRRLGLPLGEIGRALDDPAWDLRAAMGAHLGDLERRIEATSRLHGRLAHLVDAVGGDGSVTIGDDLLEVLEEMAQLESLVQRRIASLVYSDLDVAFEFLVRVFGLGPGRLFRDEHGDAVHGEIQAGDGVVWLHPERPGLGLASPRTLGAVTATTVVMVDDVDEHYRHAVEHGAEIVHEPVDQPYGYREYSARDCEGGFWSFMKPLA